MELPREKAQLAPCVLRAEQRLMGPDAQWEPLFGWPRRLAVAPKAAPRAAPRAPKALPRAPPQRMTWDAFKPLCGPWKQHRGASVAPVKKFLKKAIKPTQTATDRSRIGETVCCVADSMAGASLASIVAPSTQLVADLVGAGSSMLQATRLCR